MEVKKIAEEWEIWDEKDKAVELEEQAKKMVLEHFHKQIHIFGKKASERMFIRKIWDHAIDKKEGFVLKKGKPAVERREGEDA